MVGRNRHVRAAISGAGRWRRRVAATLRMPAFLVVLVSSAAMASAHPTHLSSITYDDLSAWRDDDHGAALAAFQLSCGEILDRGGAFARNPAYGGKRADWLEVCRRALMAQGSARHFFESEFVPVRVSDPDRPPGLFTGYFEPEFKGSRTRGGPYQVPIYRRPGDLETFDAAARLATGLAYGRRIGTTPAPYHSRQEIETGALAGRNLELVWLTDWADAFFLQIQGSGRVRLEDGSLMRLAFAAKTGLPYTAVGGILADRGDIPRSEVSMQSIRAWMAKYPEAARELMWQNQSYIFFREIPASDPSLGPPGAQQVPLTPLRSLAVDRAYWAFGTPIWLDADVPSGPDNVLQPLRKLLIAQDTGSAIKGRARGDVFWGTGDTAASVAGLMKSPGVMVALLPKAVAARLGLARK
jgi:membrane-bound lytic murein transglycosylase A